MLNQNILPTSCRYILLNYLRIFLLSLLGIIVLLLLVSSREILIFASLQASMKSTILFTLLQIPQLLPVTIPICALFSSFMLVYHLNQTHELSAFRSLGYSLRKLYCHLFFLASFIFLLTFILESEVSPYCRYKSKKMLYDNTSKNPLFLLSRQDLIKYKDIQISFDKINQNESKNLLVAFRDPHEKRVSLFMGEKINTENQTLSLENTSSISYAKGSSSPFLMIDNQEKVTLTKDSFVKSLKKNKLLKSTYKLPFKKLILKLRETRRAHTIFNEISRRVSLALLACSFLLVGLSSLSITLKDVLVRVTICFISFLFYYTAPHLKAYFLLNTMFYLLPSALLLIFSIQFFNKEARESI